jgi:hypothetical protein
MLMALGALAFNIQVLYWLSVIPLFRAWRGRKGATRPPTPGGRS